MKKLLLLLLATFAIAGSYATSVSETKPALNANQIFLPVGKTGKTISLMELSRISLKDFEVLTNQKMKFFERLAFKEGQKKLRKNISEDGSLKKKKLEKMLGKYYEGESGFHFGGFALGFFLGLIGVLIAYLIKDEKKKNRVKWAWIGVAILLVLNIIILVAI